MKKSLDFDGLMPYIEATFREGMSVKLEARGDSMRPLLYSGRDYVILSECKNPDKLKKYQTPLYKTKTGYTLHRIQKVKGREYVMCGDNNVALEYGIKPEDIVAIASGFIRKGKEFSVSSIKYRVYAFVWTNLRPIRPLIKKLNRLLRK